MMPWKPDLAILSDLSTNIFAVCIIILVILLELGRGGQVSDPAPAAAPRELEATKDLQLIERAPLRGAEMVELLFSHRPGTHGLAIDVLRDRIEVTPPDATRSTILDPQRDGRQSVVQRLDELIRSSEPIPASVYVFDNHWYALVAERLVRGSRTWRELSVPIALKRGRTGDGWSDGFLDLLTRPLDRNAFRDRLARLLGGGAGGVGGGAGGIGGGVAAPPSPPPLSSDQDTLTERILKRLQTWIAFAAIFLGLGAVFLIELLVPAVGGSRSRAVPAP